MEQLALLSRLSERGVYKRRVIQSWRDELRESDHAMARSLAGSMPGVAGAPPSRIARAVLLRLALFAGAVFETGELLAESERDVTGRAVALFRDD